MSFEEQLSVMSNADIYIFYHGAAGVFKSLVRDDALIIEFQPGNSWHTGFILVEDYQRSVHILTTTNKLESEVGSLPLLKENVNSNDAVPLFEISNSIENIWGKNRGISRSINLERIMQILNFAIDNKQSKRLNILEKSKSIYWLKEIYNGIGFHCLEED